MRTAQITREPGSSVYWIYLREDGRGVALTSALTRWGARRVARRFIAGKLARVDEELS